jgi:hypothetical protein
VTWLGVIAALALLALTPAYLAHVLRGSARPHPVSWGIWAILGVLGTASTAAAGAGPTVIVLAVTAGVEVFVFVAALHSAPVSVSARELWPLAPALIGALVWIGVHDPLAGALGVVTADLGGVWPTLKKTWIDPRSEPPLLWAGGAVAFLLGCLGVRTVALASLLYPAYLAASNTLIAGVAWYRRDRGPSARIQTAGIDG